MVGRIVSPYWAHHGSHSWSTFPPPPLFSLCLFFPVPSCPVDGGILESVNGITCLVMGVISRHPSSLIALVLRQRWNHPHISLSALSRVIFLTLHPSSLCSRIAPCPLLLSLISLVVGVDVLRSLCSSGDVSLGSADSVAVVASWRRWSFVEFFSACTRGQPSHSHGLLRHGGVVSCVFSCHVVASFSHFPRSSVASGLVVLRLIGSLHLLTSHELTAYSSHSRISGTHCIFFTFLAYLHGLSSRSRGFLLHLSSLSCQALDPMLSHWCVPVFSCPCSVEGACWKSTVTCMFLLL